MKRWCNKKRYREHVRWQRELKKLLHMRSGSFDAATITIYQH
jgi:hypothetical protein